MLGVLSAVLMAEMEHLPALQAGLDRGAKHFEEVLASLTPAELASLHVDQLARRFGCSRRHLNRLFRQHLQTSFSALRMELRLLNAIALLRHSDDKIINIAQECGFNHLGLFNARFKRRFGTSPGEWRRRVAVNHAGGNGAAGNGRNGKARPTRKPRSRSNGRKPAFKGTIASPFEIRGSWDHASPSLRIVCRKVRQLAAEHGFLLSSL